MSDIVQRLRDQGKDAFAKQYSLGMFKLCDEAATVAHCANFTTRGAAQMNAMGWQ